MTFNQRKWALTIATAAVVFAAGCWLYACGKGALDMLVPK